MKCVNKLLRILILVLMVFFCLQVGVYAGETDEVPIRQSDGKGDVTYIGTNVKVTIPKEYKQPETAMRAVWVSAFTNDINGFIDENQYKNEIIEVLNVMEHFNVNAMIFHVRARNDAFYQSKYNKWSSSYNTNPSWDALPWIIEECHRRGIEFHAWLNPYRVATSSANINELSKKFNSNNPASNPDNLLGASTCVILNPGLPNVRSFLIKTCMELIENYDVDAINFDDYFYAAGVDDSSTYAQYNPNGLSLGDWRREQINLFIKGLSSSMREFNERTGRRVQLGIAPSGIWRSGNGKVEFDANGNAITNGSSTTSSFEHYGGHLFADTLKWVNEEWIDYILPQTYWAIEHGSAGFPDLVKWWAQVVKYKKVNLFVSMGLYMRGESGSASWAKNNYEAYNQIMYASKYDTIKGTSIYTYKDLAQSVTNKRSFEGVEELWSIPTILPEIRTMSQLKVNAPNNIQVGKVENGYKISFNEVDKSKFYVIYRSDKEVTFSSTEVIDVIGNTSKDGIVNYIDLVNNDKDYYYGVKAQSYSLTLSDGVKFSTHNSKLTEEAPLDEVKNIVTSSNTIGGADITVQWNTIYHSFGDEIKYDLEFSFDGKEWTKNHVGVDVVKVQGIASTKFNIPKGIDKLYFRVKARNNVGMSCSEIKQIDIFESFGRINNFAIFGNYKTENKVEFVWNDIKGAKFIIQKSYDLFNYEDIQEVTSPGTVNVRQMIELPKERGKVYYRIKGLVNGKVGFSDVITVNVGEEFGEIVGFKINNEEPKSFYVAHEEDKIKVGFTYKKLPNGSISYVSRLSKDGYTYLLANKFNSKNTTIINGDTCEQTIYISGSELKLYYYLEVSMDGKNTLTPVYEIYVVPEYLFYDEVLNFISNEQLGEINKLDMFK